MPDPRLVTAASRLLELTRAGKLRWAPEVPPKDAPGDWRPAAFSTQVAEGTLTIASDRSEGRYPYELRVTGPGGADLGRLESGQDAELWLGDREAEPWETTLHDLYAAARDSTVNADATLDAILDELGER